MPSRKNTAAHPDMHSLTNEEIKNPYLVIDELFDFADIEDIRALLWNWFRATITGTYPKQLTRSERTVIVDMYEKMRKLTEAAHLLRSHRKAAKQ